MSSAATRTFLLGLFVVTCLLAQPCAAQKADLVAIDVLLEPDAAMINHATTLNAQLRQNYPKGYSLDASHAPHISLVQRFVRSADFDAVSRAVANVLQTQRPEKLSLKAIGIKQVEWNGLGLTVLVVEASPELRAFEQKIVDAVTPFAVSGGTADAFAAAAGDTAINKETINWVENYVPASSGENYIPHVTVGVAQPDYAKALAAKPFDAFTFGAKGVSIYQLGNFGTAQKRLWTSK